MLNDGPITLPGERVGNRATQGGQFAPLNKQVCYPEFFNIPGSGDLLFLFRTGYSGNGDWQLFRWQNSAAAVAAGPRFAQAAVAQR